MGDEFEVRRERLRPPGTTKRTARPARRSGAKNRVPVQRKLVVGASDDALEQQADAVAKSVMDVLEAPDSSRHVSVARSMTTRIARSATVGSAGGDLDDETSQAIEQARRSGSPLDKTVRRKMEGAFGADFSGVRVHVGDESDELNGQLQAKAFTSGSDIFVRRKDYAPDTTTGQTLLAHELAHTLQQGGARVSRAMDEEEAGETEAGEGEEGGEIDPNAESEASEEEQEEGGEETGEEIDFTLGQVETEDPHEPVGAGQFREDTGRASGSSRRSGTARRSKGTVTIVPTFGVSTSTTQTDFDSLSPRAQDKVNLSKVKLSTATSINPGADSFGEMMPTYKFNNITGTAKKGKIFVEANLDADYKWGTNSGGMIDVASGAAPVVTKDNYEQIVSDLTPVLEEKCWRAPRSQYWSESICARHEKYHAADETKWAKSKAKGVLATFFKKNPIELDEDERDDAGVVQRKTEEGMAEALQALDAASWAFYTGGASTYCTRSGEIRAFGDGKKPYLSLVASVKKQGKKLTAAAKKAAKKTATDTDTTGATGEEG